jgi:UDP-N-acetylglucosamine--N-acetylmuramyl-(pentapeptide) pyrophosphoryl-undecaprenol N-acetylglucosamine transferase
MKGTPEEGSELQTMDDNKERQWGDEGASGEGARPLRAAIACGGTGGHLFPGLAVGEELWDRGWDVQLMVSAKEVDQQVVRALPRMEVVTLPAVALQGGNLGAFLKASAKSRREAIRHFRHRPPDLVLAMGGFTSAPPILAGRTMGVPTFLHESNTIPGRANRWLAHLVDECFVGFPGAVDRLWHPRVSHVGTPVRRRFEPVDGSASRILFKLTVSDPVILVVGGSQGAVGLNRLMLEVLPMLAKAVPGVQVAHLTGPHDVDEIRAAYSAAGVRAWVAPFFSEMELLLNAATVVVARSGASSLAEMAAVGLPAVLVPFPSAADNHQWHNAQAVASTGAARVVEQHEGAQALLTALVPMLQDDALRERMGVAMRGWLMPDAAVRMADRMELICRARGRRVDGAAWPEPVSIQTTWMPGLAGKGGRR